MSQMTVDQALQLALQHQEAGQTAEAEDIFRQVLSAFPDQPDALHMLGALRFVNGDVSEGEQLVRRAIELAPTQALYEGTLSVILTGSGRAAEAIERLQRIVRERPDQAGVWLNLGVALTTSLRHREAVDAFQQALKITPGDPQAQMNLGITLCHVDRFEEAIWVLRDAVRTHPRVPELHIALGAALHKAQQHEAAVSAAQEAIRLNPMAAMAYQNLSVALNDLGRLRDSAEAARRAAELLPQMPSVQMNFAEMMRKLGEFDECRAAYERAIQRHPREADLYNNLGNLLGDQSDFPGALAAYRKAIELRPGVLAYYSNLLYTLQFAPGMTPDEVFAEHRRFDAAMCEPLGRSTPLPANDPAPARRLRVGYISTEFRAHALGFYLLPMMANHDKSQVDVFCYADVAQPDFMTFRLRQLADTWVDIRNVPDDALAERIRADGIDVLVDLHLHMGGNRALVFARKPAPVQIAFAGYPGTTGISAMGYRLTDKYLEPEAGPSVPSSEQVLRALETFWCYTPQADVPINPLPADSAGHITFGNLNNFKKVNEGVLTLWARTLQKVPNSRILMLAAEGSHRRWATDILRREGIAAERVQFIPRSPPEKYLAAYHQIDIGLDTFPYNGHTTSLDSFWMGVPVVTIIGSTPVSRAGWSQLSNLGLTGLAAKDADGFVEIATALADDLPRLRELRAGLRARMQSSPLMDGVRFARDIERGYRRAWQGWCASASQAGRGAMGQWIGVGGS
jgi:predicted O-linked N-acetylglucosamine transferase (SPINDLY family)